MPQSTPERQERWKDDRRALNFLSRRGVRVDRTWHFYTTNDRKLDDDEADAVAYMIEEWDFNGYIKRKLAKP